VIEDEEDRRYRAEADVLRTHPRDEQARVVAMILKQARNRRLTADERREAKRRGEALRKALRLPP
jgi:hypothetical protein